VPKIWERFGQDNLGYGRGWPVETRPLLRGLPCQIWPLLVKPYDIRRKSEPFASRLSSQSQLPEPTRISRVSVTFY